jgi:hypothetical protein
VSGEPTFMVCVLVEPEGVVYPGSRKRPCIDCGREVWASPATVEATRTHDLALVCVECGAERWARDPEPEARMLPGTAAELQAWLRRQ